MSLSASKVKGIREPGRFGDGGGLYLVVRPSGSKAWTQRIVVDGKRRDLGLGGYPAVSLLRAREKAAANRMAVSEGDNPMAKGRTEIPTFREAASSYIEANAPTWRHPKTAADMFKRFEAHAFPVFGDKRVDRITQRDVLAVLAPIWTVKPQVGRKLRQALRRVCQAEMARENIDRNPAGELIDAALPKTPSVAKHFRALPYERVSAALATVEDSSSSPTVKSCFAFAVLTAARSGEARAATRTEIDLDVATWTIPAEKMKAGREHRVPLSRQAISLLRSVEPFQDGDLIFPSMMRAGTMISDMTLTKLLRSRGLAEETTVHGFRTSFNTWAMEQTDTPWSVVQAALAHSLGTSTEQAYARSDLFDRRRVLMQEWADYLGEALTI